MAPGSAISAVPAYSRRACCKQLHSLSPTRTHILISCAFIFRRPALIPDTMGLIFWYYVADDKIVPIGQTGYRRSTTTVVYCVGLRFDAETLLNPSEWSTHGSAAAAAQMH